MSTSIETASKARTPTFIAVSLATTVFDLIKEGLTDETEQSLEAVHREVQGTVEGKTLANPTSAHYVYSTIKGGNVKVTSDKQHKLLEGRQLPHTHVYSDGSTKRVNE